MVNTKTAPRRKLELANLDAVVSDAEQRVAAQAGTTGNWSLGQILEHVAIVMEKSMDGFESKLPNFVVRLVGRFFLKNYFIKNGMTPGFRLKGPAVQEIIPQSEIDPQAALEHLRVVAGRLKNETNRASHPFFCNMTQDESNKINCRHAEMHMSFIQA